MCICFRATTKTAIKLTLTLNKYTYIFSNFKRERKKIQKPTVERKMWNSHWIGQRFAKIYGVNQRSCYRCQRPALNFHSLSESNRRLRSLPKAVCQIDRSVHRLCKETGYSISSTLRLLNPRSSIFRMALFTDAIRPLNRISPKLPNRHKLFHIYSKIW